VRLKLMRFPGGRDHYQASGQDPWRLDEVREVEALEAQRLLADFPGCWAVVVDEEPAPETVGPVAVAPAVPPRTTAARPPRRGRG
jgi:hypothetical protein